MVPWVLSIQPTVMIFSHTFCDAIYQPLMIQNRCDLMHPSFATAKLTVMIFSHTFCDAIYQPLMMQNRCWFMFPLLCVHSTTSWYKTVVDWWYLEFYLSSLLWWSSPILSVMPYISLCWCKSRCILMHPSFATVKLTVMIFFHTFCDAIYQPLMMQNRCDLMHPFSRHRWYRCFVSADDENLSHVILLSFCHAFNLLGYLCTCANIPLTWKLPTVFTFMHS